MSEHSYQNIDNKLLHAVSLFAEVVESSKFLELSTLTGYIHTYRLMKSKHIIHRLTFKRPSRARHAASFYMFQ